MTTINEAIEMMPKGWTLARFNCRDEVMYEKGAARLTRSRTGTWSCEVQTTEAIFYTQSVAQTPEEAIACVQEQITRRIAVCAKLLTAITGVEV